jgi:hypothetical protein
MVLHPATLPEAPPACGHHPARPWLWLVGLAAVLLVGVLVGRLSAPSAAPPTLAVIHEERGVTGYSRVVAGVPVGYAHTERGAVSAATNYLAALATAAIADAPRRHQMIASLAAAQSAASLQRQYDWASGQVRRDLHLDQPTDVQVVVRLVPVGWQVSRYTDATAEVVVFGTGLYGSSVGVPVRETWGVNTVTLTWQGDDWKLVRSVTQTAIVPLADPRSRAVDDNGSGLAPQVSAFKEYRYGS